MEPVGATPLLNAVQPLVAPHSFPSLKALLRLHRLLLLCLLLLLEPAQPLLRHKCSVRCLVGFPTHCRWAGLGAHLCTMKAKQSCKRHRQTHSALDNFQQLALVANFVSFHEQSLPMQTALLDSECATECAMKWGGRWYGRVLVTCCTAFSNSGAMGCPWCRTMPLQSHTAAEMAWQRKLGIQSVRHACPSAAMPLHAESRWVHYIHTWSRSQTRVGYRSHLHNRQRQQHTAHCGTACMGITAFGMPDRMQALPPEKQCSHASSSCTTWRRGGQHNLKPGPSLPHLPPP